MPRQESLEGPPFETESVCFRTLNLTVARQTLPFDTTFDTLAEQLSAWQRLVWEPDGSFVWSGEAPNQQRWQLDGVVYDRGNHVEYVELKGFSPQFAFDQFCDLIHSPAICTTQLIAQLLQPAVFMDLAEFRRLVWGNHVIDLDETPPTPRV